METDPKRPDTRFLFRCLAGVSCPFFFFGAATMAFPQIVGESGPPSFLLAGLLLWGGLLFASIAVTGKLRQ
jgi:ABC-type transport system involved in cytochrome c biogenesis permease component